MKTIERFMAIEKGSFGGSEGGTLNNMVTLFDETTHKKAGWQVLHTTAENADAATSSIAEEFFLTQPPYSHIKITFERMDD